jgi:anti-sigma28 factor (negative regulator of flagellin synthesis)
MDGTLMIEQIRAKIRAGRFEFSKHAVDQSILRQISVQELREAIANGEIIEDYPEDKYGPSCLVLGYTRTGRPLHIQSRSFSPVGQNHHPV